MSSSAAPSGGVKCQQNKRDVGIKGGEVHKLYQCLDPDGDDTECRLFHIGRLEFFYNVVGTNDEAENAYAEFEHVFLVWNNGDLYYYPEALFFFGLGTVEFRVDDESCLTCNVVKIDVPGLGEEAKSGKASEGKAAKTKKSKKRKAEKEEVQSQEY